jgi:hypothetical protein
MWVLGADMRGAHGKPIGTAARVGIRQFIIPIRVKPSNAKVAIEAPRRSKFNFPGRQKAAQSNAWGSTKCGWSQSQCAEWCQSGRLVAGGAMARHCLDHARTSFSQTQNKPAVVYSTMTSAALIQDSSPTPGAFYTCFYNHAHRLRSEKLLYLELTRSPNGFF